MRVGLLSDTHVPRVKKELPKEFQEELKDYILFPDKVLLDKWRNYRSGLFYESKIGIRVIGALDDLLVDRKTEKIYTPLDFKTKGSSKITQSDSKKYYGLQLSFYALMLEKNGYKTSGVGYLLY